MDIQVPQTRSNVDLWATGNVEPVSWVHPTIPERFGPYRLIRPLGRGGMGEVHLAEDLVNKGLVALKFSRFGTQAYDAEGAERFRREIQAASQFHHPGLCTVRDAGELGDFKYLAMDYIEGDPLSEVLRLRITPMDQSSVAGMVRKVATAMDEAHAHGMIHRDLKPSNILIRRGGDPVVIDFGLVCWSVAHETRITKTGTVLGTPHYMSPEQVNGDVRAIGPGCDIYSLGVVLYELLAGKLPFEGSLASVLGKILFFEPLPPSSHRPNLDPRLEAICRKAMAKEIPDRYLTMREMIRDLERL